MSTVPARRPRRPHAAATLLLTLAAAAGCGGPERDYSSLDLATVEGRVTLDGEPLEGATVRFYKTGDRRRYSYGETDAGGRYELRFNSRRDGVLPGTKEVTISTSAKGPEVKNPGGTELVPVRYNRDTELTAVLTGGDAHTLDFDLTSDGEIVQPEAGDEQSNGET